MSVLTMPDDEDDEDDAKESSLNTTVGPMNHRYETFWVEKAEKKVQAFPAESRSSITGR